MTQFLKFPICSMACGTLRQSQCTWRHILIVRCAKQSVSVKYTCTGHSLYCGKHWEELPERKKRHILKALKIWLQSKPGKMVLLFQKVTVTKFCVLLCVCIRVHGHTYVSLEGPVGASICIYIYIKPGICTYSSYYLCGISIPLLVQQHMYQIDNTWEGIESIYWQQEKWFMF